MKENNRDRCCAFATTQNAPPGAFGPQRREVRAEMSGERAGQSETGHFENSPKDSREAPHSPGWIRVSCAGAEWTAEGLPTIPITLSWTGSPIQVLRRLDSLDRFQSRCFVTPHCEGGLCRTGVGGLTIRLGIGIATARNWDTRCVRRDPNTPTQRHEHCSNCHRRRCLASGRQGGS